MPSISHPSTPPVSLPSIHELFPEHLSHSSRPHHHRQDPARASHHYRPSHSRDFYPPPTHLPGPPAHPSHHVQHNRQAPLTLSIPPSPHPARPPKRQTFNSHSPPPPPIPTYPGSSHPAPPQLGDPENPTNIDGESSTQSGPRKHICPRCDKAFNRPSSLKIHYNTHTGATPFRCPWPKCGREFNVNSNMRRHYRNHTANANEGNQDDTNDARSTRRRRSSTSSTNSPVSPLPMIQQQSPGVPLATYEPSPRSSHPSSRFGVYDYRKDHHHQMDVDDADDDYPVSGHPHRLPVPIIRASQAQHQQSPRHLGPPSTVSPSYSQNLPHHHHHHHSHSYSSSSSIHLRALTPGSSFHSSSPSPSPSPSLSASVSPFHSPALSAATSPALSPAMSPRSSSHASGQQQQQRARQQLYNPSMPYLRSGGDNNGVPVSTALRPAFGTNTR